MAGEQGGWVAVEFVCMYVCWRGWKKVGAGGCQMCILRVAAVFAFDYPL